MQAAVGSGPDRRQLAARELRDLLVIQHPIPNGHIVDLTIEEIASIVEDPSAADVE